MYYLKGGVVSQGIGRQCRSHEKLTPPPGYETAMDQAYVIIICLTTKLSKFKISKFKLDKLHPEQTNIRHLFWIMLDVHNKLLIFLHITEERWYSRSRCL